MPRSVVSHKSGTPLVWPTDYINRIICGNCLEVMKGIPDGVVDLVVTDPPYGVGLDYGENFDDSDQAWDSMFISLVPAVKRLASMVIMPSCQIKKLPFIYKHHPPDWLIAWYKGSPGHVAYVGFNDWEPHLVYGKPKGLCMHDYFQTKLVPADNGHPCPKPIEWARWLITRASKPGDVILDCFLGSGTTCVAAKQLGREYIGIEINSDYCKIAEDRLRQEELF